MTKCYQTSLEFPSVKRRKVEADFSGGDIISTGGIPLLTQVDQTMGLIPSVARALQDPRRQASCDHTQEALLRQRVYALAFGFEDLSDHAELRHDLVLQTATARVETLASPATLCRLEQRADRASAAAIHDFLFQQCGDFALTVPTKRGLDCPAAAKLIAVDVACTSSPTKPVIDLSMVWLPYLPVAIALGRSTCG